MLKHSFKFLLLASLVLSAYQTQAASWTAPTFNPPTCPDATPGCNVPLNVSNTSQTKAASLITNGFRSLIDLYVDGKVGVGTVYPATKLDLYGVLRVAKDGVAGGTPGANNGIFVYRASGNSEIRTQSGTTNYADWGSGPFSHYFYGYGNVPFVVATNGTEKVRVDSAGNVGIGVTAPASKLDVNGDICWTLPVVGRKCLSTTSTGGGTSYWATNAAGDIRNTNTDAGGLPAQVNVKGQIKIEGGNPAADRVLASNANGLAEWKDAGKLPGGIGNDVLNTTFSGCLPLVGCTTVSGDPGPTQSHSLIDGVGTVTMTCPAGYKVVSGGADCDKSWNAIVAVQVAFLNASRPISTTQWQVQCTKLTGSYISLITTENASAIKNASITCAR